MFIRPMVSSGNNYLFYDSFTDIDNIGLITHSPNIDVDTVGTGWQSAGSGNKIFSNRMSTVAGGTDTCDPGVRDVRIEVDVSFPNSAARANILTKCDIAATPASYWRIDASIVNNNKIKIFKWTGSQVLVASGTTVLVPTQTYKVTIELNGLDISVWVDGNLEIDAYTTDGMNLASTICGMNTQITGTTFDDYKIWAL
jgi:hypothetical protein